MGRGKLIVFEGIDGCGKGTQIELLSEALAQRGIDAKLTREPTGGEIGRLLRRCLSGEVPASEEAIAALFAADRLEHVLGADGLAKRIEAGESFICDRYYFSSYAYHGVRMPLEWVIDANRLCADALRPDLTVFLDIEPSEAVRRVYAGRDKVEIFENEARLTEVRDLYLKVFHQMRETERVAVIDGARPREEIARDVLARVLPLFAEETSEVR